VALFAFFLLSNAIFGTLAFRALSTATVRAAAVLAERVTDDAARGYNESGSGVELLGNRGGGNLLEYRDGALREGSVEELVQLGLYEGWLPLEAHDLLGRREALRTLGEGSLGEWAYVSSFRRLPDGDVLAAPVSLEAGAIAVRRREVVDLLGFAAIVGGALSLALAFLVGRTLARPLLTLQVASERVGGGNLRLRLPEERADEFGSVFIAFNGMVERLRRARRDLLRTTRRTEAIVEEAATGVIALDAAGRVTLVNPRAEAFLGREIPLGETLAAEGGPADELVRWIDLYFRDGIRESGTDLQFAERRIRVRARRISRMGPLGGAVLSLEDVTDELRTERILAWGEMAQQVAHEVKNPLTPIKLSVQHIQRAWEDRRTDYDTILSRNVEAILGEIDRLASIASSFSRFGAPRAAGEPLEAVDLRRVIQETLALYEVASGASPCHCPGGGAQGSARQPPGECPGCGSGRRKRPRPGQHRRRRGGAQGRGRRDRNQSGPPAQDLRAPLLHPFHGDRAGAGDRAPPRGVVGGNRRHRERKFGRDHGHPATRPVRRVTPSPADAPRRVRT
jgi:PAS domain-containing protein